MVCSERSEDSAFLEREKIPHTMIPAWKLLRQSPLRSLAAFRRARELVETFKPDVVFCKGGAVSVPIAWAAYRRKIPIILHESDAVMGRANRLIARIATETCLGFPSQMSNEKLAGSNCSLLISHCSFTGNPLRSEITQGSREEGLHLTGFSGSRPVLLIMGGSQGAQAINEWTAAHLQELTKMCDVIHLTGKVRAEGHKGQGPRAQIAPLRPCALGYFPLDFAHKELPHLYACSDLAMSRAGAGSIAELAGNGISSILIPLRGVAHDHQYFNAVSLQIRGAAVLVTQNDMDKKLMNMVKQLIHDPTAREILRSKIRAFCIGDSTGQIVNIISRTLVEHRRT
jgi:UDP-N-acetylglucosamine--N-acetylmuramyl-(pentapeptide) pyrophosphoryl-undecaprenol N-acetylglucosamine transferase